MRSHSRGFTLVELIASVVIIAILAALTFPNVNAANPFAERGYADVVAAQLRQARDVALATGCDVRFTINAAGYNAMQRAAAGTHCDTAGAWTRTLFIEAAADDVILGAPRQLVFDGADGRTAADITIDIGARQLLVERSGLVSGP